MATRYAEQTSVSVERSKAEIEAILDRYGAEAFQYGRNQDKAVIEFICRNRRVRFVLPLPRRDADEFTKTPTKQREVRPDQALSRWEQACRQRWRALALAIKAKLEAVSCGIATFDEEFLAHVVDPGTGLTIGETLTPRLEVAYAEHRSVLKLHQEPKRLKGPSVCD